ncbi:MAG: hypothetical protein GY953_21495 [bacterium]|nr:hypothetical protein [bacterium]
MADLRRRHFLHGSFAAVLAQASPAPDLDRFGGWKRKRFEAAGFFRIEHDDRRYWLATPDGHGFLIHGMDHVGLERISQPYNRQHWDRKLGLPKDAGRRTRLKTFYEQKVAADREYLGFNCLYSHQAPFGADICPYIPRVRTLDIEYWRMRRGFREENFLDVFADNFVARCENKARQMVKEGRAGDPWVLAHALTDSPVLVPAEARPFRAGFYHKPLPGTTTWPVRLRNLGANAAGKRAYVKLMRERYGNSTERFNGSYNTAFESWNALAAAENWRPRTDPSGNIHEERDNHAFLLRILDKAWATQVRVIRSHDPNHLTFGDTLNLNSPLPDDIIRLYAKHFPVIVYQYYGATWEDHRLVLDRLRRLTGGMPVFCADSSWSVKDPPRMPDTLGPQCANFEIAARRMSEVYRAAFARPDFLGWGWCGWMDQWESAEPFMQHGGLQDAFGKWHQPLADAFSDFGNEMYAIAQPDL